MPSLATAPTPARHHAAAPQRETPGEHTWITRGANFVVALSQVRAGTVLERRDQPDEHMVLLADLGARIEAGGEVLEAGPESLTIVPPGPSRESKPPIASRSTVNAAQLVPMNVWPATSARVVGGSRQGLAIVSG